MSIFDMKPKTVTNVESAFGPSNIYDGWLPNYEDIPDEFKPRGYVSVDGVKKYGDGVSERAAKFMNFVSDMFFRGLSNLELYPKEGIDPQMAWDHVATCMRSWEPKHEHKESGCAFLLSIWFEDISWTPGDPRK